MFVDIILFPLLKGRPEGVVVLVTPVGFIYLCSLFRLALRRE